MKKRSRSKSVIASARKGLAALGIGEAAKDSDDRDDRSSRGGRDRSRSRPGRDSRRYDDFSDDEYDDRRGSRRPPRERGETYGNPRSAMKKDGQRNKAAAEGRRNGGSSSSDLGSSTEDEKRIKKMKGKQLITAGLATVATIHAAHNIYQSMEKRDARHKAVQEGEMTQEEARKLRTKATLQDAASIGIAALGIKGAISEVKEANEMRHEFREFSSKKEERHQKRLERQKKSSGGQDRGGGRRRDYDENQGLRYRDGNPYSSLPAPDRYNDRR